MQTYTVAVVLVGIIIAILSTSSTMGLAIDCEASPNIRRICEVLVAGSDLMGERSEAMVERDQQQKRQDVDHVFLRFGRRFGSF